DLVDLHDGMAVLVVAGDDAPDGEGHGLGPPWFNAGSFAFDAGSFAEGRRIAMRLALGARVGQVYVKRQSPACWPEQARANRTGAPMTAPAQIVPPYKPTPLFPLGADSTPYRKLTSDGVRVEKVMGRDVVVIEREALRALAEAAFTDINHLLRPKHLASLKAI